MLALIPIFFIISWSIVADEIQCIEAGKIEEIRKNNSIKRDESFCFSQTQIYFLQKKCHLSQNCLAIKALSPDLNSHPLYSSIGRDEFKICRIFKGDPSLIRYYDGRKWHQGAICSFSDRSFIGIDHLALRNQRIRKE